MTEDSSTPPPLPPSSPNAGKAQPWAQELARRLGLRSPWALLAALLLALLAWQWYQAYSGMSALREELAGRPVAMARA